MDKKESNPMTPFDNLVTSQSLQMLKILIPYTPPSNQRLLAIYVKFLELQNTMKFFQFFTNDLQSSSFESGTASPLDILEEMKPYMGQEMNDTISNFTSMMSMMEMMKSFQDGTGDSPDGFSSDNENTSQSSAFNPMDLMKNMMSPDQQEMFDTYSTLFAAGSSNDINDESSDGSDDSNSQSTDDDNACTPNMSNINEGDVKNE